MYLQDYPTGNKIFVQIMEDYSECLICLKKFFLKKSYFL